MHNCCLIFVASTTVVTITIQPFEVLATCCVEEDDRCLENVLDIFRSRCDIRQVPKEMGSNRGVSDELRIIHDLGRVFSDLRVHPSNQLNHESGPDCRSPITHRYCTVSMHLIPGPYIVSSLSNMVNSSVCGGVSRQRKLEVIFDLSP